MTFIWMDRIARPILTGLALVGMLAVAGDVAAQGHAVRFADHEPIATPLRDVPALETQPLGDAPGRAWIRALATFEVPGQQGQWRHLLYYKKQGRAERTSWLVTLDLNTGQLKEHPAIPGLETLPTVWSKGKLYLGQNLPGHLVVYDPQADAATDLGHAFEKASTVYRLSAASDGKVALGGNHPAEVSLYNPANGSFKKFGPLKTENGYCYYLGQDDQYLYAVTRGKQPWELWAIHKETGESRIIAQRPVEGYMRIRQGNRVFMRQAMQDPDSIFTMHHGQLTPVTEEAAPAAAKPASPAPMVQHDTLTVYDDGKVTLHYQQPGDLTQWKQARLAVPLGAESLLEVTALSPDTLVTAAGAYVPVLVIDVATGQTRFIANEALSVRSMRAVGRQVFMTGYPSAGVYRLDLDRPTTSTASLPGQPAIHESDPRANPRMLMRFPMTPRSGGHIGIGLYPGPDGNIYLITRRHRHARGFSVAWFNPTPDKDHKHAHGQFDVGQAFDHLQIGGIAQSQDQRHLLLTTYVEPYEQLGGQPPAVASVFVVDLAEKKIIAQWSPVADSTCLTGIAEVEPGVAVGLALDQDRKTTLIYRLDLRTGKVLAAKHYDRVILGRPGVTAQPVKGMGLEVGPDGWLWTSIEVAANGVAVLVRIDPHTLDIHPVGRGQANASMIFHQGVPYITGQQHLRRIILPPNLSSQFTHSTRQPATDQPQ